MGLLVHDLRLLREARARGACFGRALTLGRQQVFATPRELRREGIEPGHAFAYGHYLDASDIPAALGVRDLVAADASAYEGASLVHDFNEPLPDAHRGRYDLVADGGTLEHIFNVPVALANCMRALRVGGTYLGSHPANNMMGHGLYQFSPDFYFRALAPENGFRVDVLEVHESRYPAVERGFVRRRYTVADPASVGGRIGLQSPRAAMLRVVATKVDDREPFTSWPQQSDYAAMWQNGTSAPTGWRAVALRLLPSAVTGAVIAWRHRGRSSVRNRAHFHRR